MQSTVVIHASVLGERRHGAWYGSGWRHVKRVVSDIEADPEYENVGKCLTT